MRLTVPPHDSADTPLILFGACDRHNLGDLLFPRLAERLLAPRPVIAAGIAERDLTPWGGHRVRALANLAGEWSELPADILHPGGETLTCSLYQAAIMTLPPAEADAASRHWDADPAGALAWARAQTGLTGGMAYLTPRTLFRNPRRIVHHACGGVTLDRLASGQREEVLARLREADAVSVRDHVSRTHLAGAGIEARLAPDLAVLTAELFAGEIAAHGRQGEPAAVAERFPQGWLAVQFSADLGDDPGLDVLAGQLNTIAADTGFGLVLFRAGAAPWHDDPDAYRRLARRLDSPPHLFDSLHIWDLCALIAQSRAYAGTSLHGRILADAFAVPAISLLPAEADRALKLHAWQETWGGAHAGAPVRPAGLATALGAALRTDGRQARGFAGELAETARCRWAEVRAMLG
ncbi:MAG TPA: polysaccharide pyruvyl transferase family protein [Thiobacillaceae bacterium]|nr:polysaccharide pyruvyl transferase family protein [Thiobacillaceae bacterium]